MKTLTCLLVGAFSEYIDEVFYRKVSCFSQSSGSYSLWYIFSGCPFEDERQHLENV